MTIYIFRRIIIGLYYAGRGTQSQLKRNEKLVYFENDNFSFFVRLSLAYITSAVKHKTN